MTHEKSGLPYVAELESALQRWRDEFATHGWKIRQTLCKETIFPVYERSGTRLSGEWAVFVGRLDADPLEHSTWVELRIKDGENLEEVKVRILTEAQAFAKTRPYTLVDVGGNQGVVLLNMYDDTMKPNVFWRRWWYRLTGRLV